MKKEEITKFYLKYRFYLFPAIVALSSLILIIFVIYPQMISLINNQTLEKSNLNKSKLLEAKAQTLESYDLSDLNRKMGFALGSYPTDRDSIYALGVLQRLMAQLEFNIISISLGSSAPKPGATQSYVFKLEILGPLSKLSSLFTSIENSSRLMRVNGVEVGGISALGVNISLGVELLYGAAPLGFGSIDSPLPTLSEKDEEVVAKLVRSDVPTTALEDTVQLGPRGKSNPFE